LPYTDKQEALEQSRKHNQTEARKARNRERQVEYNNENLERYLLITNRSKAKKKGILFTLSIKDIVIPVHCPVTGLELKKGDKPRQPNCPCLEMLDPALGYVPGNVRVVAFKATWRQERAKKTGIKVCPACNKAKSTDDFYWEEPGQRYSVYCRECKEEYRSQNREQALVTGASNRAKQRNQPCTITVADVVIPDECPVLGIKLERGSAGKANPASPSLDCYFPELGYVPGNVTVMSHKANMIKSSATFEEFEKVYLWFKKENDARSTI
jgi:hypothetical protein